MPPIRTKQSQNADSSTPKQEDKKRKRHAKQREGAPLSLSKIKSALRSTRRRLAKEDLGADVRIESERKLKSLEADLVVATRAKTERAMATRYHKIKFFDRQKLLRKITQMKRRLEGEGISSNVRKSLNTELFDLRVDLNYVMNYPKLEKYISLYPPKVRSGEGAATPIHSEASLNITDEKRERIREWVRGKMRVGEMSGEPETLEHRTPVQKNRAEQWKGSVDKDKRPRGAAMEEVEETQEEHAQDDFFEDDDSDSETGDLDAEPALTHSVDLPSQRPPDKVANQSHQRAKPAEKHQKQLKRPKHRRAASPAPAQDSFFNDESE